MVAAKFYVSFFSSKWTRCRVFVLAIDVTHLLAIGANKSLVSSPKSKVTCGTRQKANHANHRNLLTMAGGNPGGFEFFVLQYYWQKIDNRKLVFNLDLSKSLIVLIEYILISCVPEFSLKMACLPDVYLCSKESFSIYFMKMTYFVCSMKIADQSVSLSRSRKICVYLYCSL